MPIPGIGCGTPKSRMASELSLADYASRPKNGRGWVDDLPDDIFNQIWDARHTGHIGKEMTAGWLRMLGYDGATAGRVETILVRERR
jgi:hypothetical protein